MVAESANPPTVKVPVLLFDTNIWVGFELRDRGFEQIEDLMRLARRNGARIGIAAHSLKDVFTIVERRLKAAEQADQRMRKESVGPAARVAAWAVINHILGFAEIVGSDYLDAYMAMKDRVFHDFYENNLVIAAVRRMQADLLVTQNRALINHSPVPALDVQRAITWLEEFSSSSGATMHASQS